MALDMVTFAAALKQHYQDITVKNLTYKNHPFHALVKKYEKFGGLNMPLPLRYGNPQGRSAAFANALAQKTNTQVKAFTLTRVQDYSLANIQNEVLEASESNSDAFMKAATTEIDGAFLSLMHSMASAEYRSGTGSIGQISAGSTVGSATITLAQPADIVNFEVGMTLALSSADGSGLRTGSVVISALNRSTGTLTASGNWTAGIAAAAAGDFISVAGDFNAKMSGLAAWIPLADPSATAFFGVDRTSDVTRLGGLRKNVSALPIEEGLIDVIALICREGGTPDHAFMNFQNYANLEKALGSKVIYDVAKDSEGIIGFEGIKVHGQKGPVKVIPDQNCQADRFFALELDTWQLASLGAAPKLLKTDGMDFLRVSSADAIEVRAGMYGQLGCDAPGFNAVGQLA